MTMTKEFKIDLSEKFPHLSRAPVVEAVIDIRARSTAWKQETVTEQFSQRMPEFSQIGPAEEVTEGSAWTNLQFATRDGVNIAEFGRDGFAYHRLAPYERWDKFNGEGLRLWQIFMEIARPVELQRVGVRFIGRLELPPLNGEFEDYIDPAPKAPAGMELPFVGFLHHDTLAVPGYPYVVNIIRTIERPQDPTQSFAVILDIDVGTLKPIPPNMSELQHCLSELRWLKNKAFFGSVTSKAVESYK